MKEIPLGVNRSGYHHIASVQIDLYHAQDGVVTNDWRNRHLSGSIAQLRAKRTESAVRYHELIGVDQALDQSLNIEKQLTQEHSRIEGSSSDRPEVGERNKLIEVRQQLFDWFTLSEEDKQHIKEYFLSMERPGATNVTNKAIGRSALTAARQNNPSAMLAASLPLSKTLDVRSNQIYGDILKNYMRRAPILRIIRAENQQLHSVHSRLADLVENQDAGTLAELTAAARKLRFRVQPFNYLAFQLRPSRGRLEEPEPIEMALQGLALQRYGRYLSAPLTKPLSEQRDEALRERLEFLESLKLAGEYRRLGIRICERFDYLLTNRNSASQKRNTKEARELIRYNCLPSDKPYVKSPWYEWQL